MDKGQKAKEIFSFVNSGSAPSFDTEDCAFTVYDCEYHNLVLANGNGNDLENDKSSILGMFETWTTSAVFVLQKKTGGVFIDKATISNNTYGDWYPQGTWTSKPKYAGFIAHWDSILTAFNTGIYRFKVTEVNPLYPSGKIKYSHTFCLKEYNCNTPENTVRLEWYNNKKLGSIEDDRTILDFADINWYNQYRFANSIFGFPKSSYETEEIQYTNGEFEPVKEVQTETYQLRIGSIPSYMHDIIKTYALMSGTLSITDYSSNNPAQIISKAVKRKSGYEPKWSKQNKCAPVVLEFEPRFNNLETFRC